MTLPTRVGYLLLAVFIGLLLAWGALYAVSAAPSGSATSAALASTPTPLPIQPVVSSPDISFIDSPSPTCVLPRRGTNICYMSWYYMYASASPNYMITMTVDIDGRARARYGGFFQTYMYVPAEMLAFRVDCGVPGASGDPNWGLSHSYTLRGRDSANLKAANYGNVYCPADQVSLASASLSGPASGKQHRNYNFIVNSSPITTTQPITYTWQVTDYPPMVDNGGVSKNRNFSWDSSGPKTVQVTISNPVSSLVRSHTILVEPYRLYLSQLGR